MKLYRKDNNHCLVLGSVMRSIYIVIGNTDCEKICATIASNYWSKRKKERDYKINPTESDQRFTT